MASEAPDVHDKLMDILKRRGYLQPSYEIYGGVAGFFDYGPLGAALKTNVENLWRRFFVLEEGMAEIQCPTISPEQVFRASGHLEKFADTVIDCPECGVGSRADHLVRNEWKRIWDQAEPILRKAGADEDMIIAIGGEIEEIRAIVDRDPAPKTISDLLHGTHAVVAAMSETAFDSSGVSIIRAPMSLKITKGGKVLFNDAIKCLSCQKPLDIDKARIDAFNLMFKTTVGPGSGRAGYLRPETAQGMFMDFMWISRYFRGQMPFGAVQLGKAYRNEISPRQSLLRLREFHQMEAEVFFDPQDKTWPRYQRLASKELTLLARDTSAPVRMRMDDAVTKGVIANGALGYFVALTAEFLETAGIPTEALRFRQHGLQEKAHYATDTWDAEFLSPRFGWVEIVGIADRTDYDLKAHERVSGQKLRQMRRFAEAKEVDVNRFVAIPPKLGPLFKGDAPAVTDALKEMEAPEHTVPTSVNVTLPDGRSVKVPQECYRIERRRERIEGEWYVPHVVEPSFGIDRVFYAVLETSYSEAEWATLRLSPRVSPIKCGVFPLMSKDGLDEIALALDRELREAGVAAQFDDGGAIGRRYARQDEIGTPYCVTVDYDTKKDGTVTIRERDGGKQKRIAQKDVLTTLQKLVAGKLTFDDVGGVAVA